MSVTLSADLFNFDNVADLPEKLQGKLVRERVETEASAQPYVDLINVAGRSVTISELIGAAIRAYGAENVRGHATVRAYLNFALSAGKIKKTSRQKYAALGAEDEDDDNGEPEAKPDGSALDALLA